MQINWRKMHRFGRTQQMCLSSLPGMVWNDGSGHSSAADATAEDAIHHQWTRRMSWAEDNKASCGLVPTRPVPFPVAHQLGILCYVAPTQPLPLYTCPLPFISHFRPRMMIWMLILLLLRMRCVFNIDHSVSGPRQSPHCTALHGLAGRPCILVLCSIRKQLSKVFLFTQWTVSEWVGGWSVSHANSKVNNIRILCIVGSCPALTISSLLVLISN